MVLSTTCWVVVSDIYDKEIIAGLGAPFSSWSVPFLFFFIFAITGIFPAAFLRQSTCGAP